MTQITQGSVISGVRSDKYEKTNCYAIVINARCDLAQDKINKVYYIIAIPLNDWIFTSYGYQTIFCKKAKDVSGRIKSNVSGGGLSWEDLKDFSIDDFDTVISSSDLKNDKKEQAKIDFREYKHLTSERATRNDILNAIKTHKKDINIFLGEMSNGKNANFLLLPESALKGGSLSRGIVVDLRELDYFNMPQIDSLVKDKIDSHNIKLTQDEKELYNKRFFVLEEPGYSTILDEVSSPWIEFIVQRFVNAFIRVGVDNITQQQIESTISKIIEEGEKDI